MPPEITMPRQKLVRPPPSPRSSLFSFPASLVALLLVCRPSASPLLPSSLSLSPHLMGRQARRAAPHFAAATAASTRCSGKCGNHSNRVGFFLLKLFSTLIDSVNKTESRRALLHGAFKHEQNELWAAENIDAQHICTLFKVLNVLPHFICYVFYISTIARPPIPRSPQSHHASARSDFITTTR